ncbi:MAG: hypothetical protein GY870_04720 [archaeon]|nr:hypothetical protein [archaeon]
MAEPNKTIPMSKEQRTALKELLKRCVDTKDSEMNPPLLITKRCISVKGN